ncbi:317_t:CDS:2 [Funneliformis geosporum]|uniref:317_t:CDS:1 n=1 Tax=Funneliformis geosporum TaxID=1117311 RepID=A0A9W4WJE2_9GLOM|nr:317_t:CDS:2 [Funneliformis geosporum]
MSPIEKNNFNVDFYCSGSYGVVSCANWKGSETIMALKLSHNLSIKEVVNVVNEQFTTYLHQAEKLFLEIHDKEEYINTFIDNLIRLLNKTLDEGNDFNESEHFINHYMLLSDRSSNEWSNKNQMKSKYQIFLGILYYNNIKIDKSYGDAFELFLSTSENNYSIAQVYLANCYKTGFGTEINYDHAFNWMQKAVESESIYGQLNIGIYYEQGIGTDKNLIKAFYWYQ